jgi:CBS-domain-containing membrane protein
MFSIYGTTGQTFRGTLESFMPLAGVVRARNTRKSDDPLLNSDEQFHETPGKSTTPRLEPDRFSQAARAYDKMNRQQNKRTPVCHAYQVMSHDVLTLNPTDTVGAAWVKLAERRVHQSPVLGPTKEVVGLVSDRDLLMVANLEGNLLTGLLNRPISELMTSPVACSAPVTDVRRIARVILATGLSAVPIVDDAGQLLGIVSRGDILRAIVNDPPLSLWI